MFTTILRKTKQQEPPQNPPAGPEGSDQTSGVEERKTRLRRRREAEEVGARRSRNFLR